MQSLVIQTRFVPIKENKIKRRNGNLRSALNLFNKLIDSNPTKELAKYFKKRKRKKRHEKALIQMFPVALS